MTQITPILSTWFVTENHRAKAQLKYELKHLESRLHKYLDVHSDFAFCPDEVNSLCATLSQLYLNYLNLIVSNNNIIPSELSAQTKVNTLPEQYKLIVQLKNQLAKTVDLEEEVKLIIEIATLYHQCTKSMSTIAVASNTSLESNEPFEGLKQLFSKGNLKQWLSSLVTLMNLSKNHYNEPSLLFSDWGLEQQKSTLNFFSDPDLINLVNAIFFYKLYPDKLFNELIHPVKLVSVRIRLGLLHEFIELLQKQLYSSALQQSLKPGIDLLFHGDELPQGIMIEVNEEYREIIQLAVKQIKVKLTFENEEQATIDRLHDLGRAYKFWFNPNRLIDAVMVLQQRLVNDENEAKRNLVSFHDQMLILYKQLTTTECLDLYGYFANNDSRYLLYTLFTIMQGKPLDWLPSLNEIEKDAIERVFKALQCVMEALRVELKNRHVTTEPYVYDLAKQFVQAGRRNRDAVFRILAIYGCGTVTKSDAVEKLFNCVEEPL